MKTNESITIDRLAYTKAELCIALGLSPVSIWRLERRKLLHPVPGVRHKLYTVQEVQRFLAGAHAGAVQN